MKEDFRPAAARRSDLLGRPERLPLLEALLPFGPVPPDGRDELLRQRIDDAGADAVQAAGGLVVPMVELAARVQHREDHFHRALLARRVLVDRNPPPIVLDGDRRAVLVQGHPDVRRMAVHRLVDGVVENFPDEMMQTGGADAADVHARPATNRFEALEDSDVFCGICH